MGGGGDSCSQGVIIVRSRRRKVFWWKMTLAMTTLRRQQVLSTVMPGLVVISPVGPDHKEGQGEETQEPPLPVAGSSVLPAAPIGAGLLLQRLLSSSSRWWGRCWARRDQAGGPEGGGQGGRGQAELPWTTGLLHKWTVLHLCQCTTPPEFLG